MARRDFNTAVPIYMIAPEDVACGVGVPFPYPIPAEERRHGEFRAGLTHDNTRSVYTPTVKGADNIYATFPNYIYPDFTFSPISEREVKCFAPWFNYDRGLVLYWRAILGDNRG